MLTLYTSSGGGSVSCWGLINKLLQKSNNKKLTAGFIQPGNRPRLSALKVFQSLVYNITNLILTRRKGIGRGTAKNDKHG
jgi:hypothetical protein